MSAKTDEGPEQDTVIISDELLVEWEKKLAEAITKRDEANAEVRWWHPRIQAAKALQTLVQQAAEERT